MNTRIVIQTHYWKKQFPKLRIPFPSLPSDKSFVSRGYSKHFAGFASHNIGPIGFDIEELDEGVCYQEISARFFHQDEHETLIKNPYEQVLLFYRLWTLKEASAKLLGLPLAQVLPQRLICTDDFNSLQNLWEGTLRLDFSTRRIYFYQRLTSEKIVYCLCSYDHIAPSTILFKGVYS